MALHEMDLLMTDLSGPYVVTAYKANRRIKNAGLHIFGPFDNEEEAQAFADRVSADTKWELDEIPVLNKPETFGTGEERL
jgi:hypothetical protein